jgi:hypothetical protein
LIEERNYTLPGICLSLQEKALFASTDFRPANVCGGVFYVAFTNRNFKGSDEVKAVTAEDAAAVTVQDTSYRDGD